MSVTSTAVAVPTGPVDWCLFPDWRPPHLLPGLDGPPHCGNGQPGKTELDYGTICCDGDIVNTRVDMFVNGPRDKIDLANLVCCRIERVRALQDPPPLPPGQRTQCLKGTPTPLLSLAATNTGNRMEYGITYTGVTSEGLSYSTMGTSRVLVATETPNCLWFNTASVSNLKDITVQALQASPTSTVSSGIRTTGTGTGPAIVQTSGGMNSSKPTSPASRLKTRVPGFYLWTMLCVSVVRLHQ